MIALRMILNVKVDDDDLVDRLEREIITDSVVHIMRSKLVQLSQRPNFNLNLHACWKPYGIYVSSRAHGQISGD